MKQEIEKTENKFRIAFSKEVYDVAKNNPHKPKKISDHIILINFSSIIGNPWNVDFYMWEQSAKLLLQYISKHDITDWKKWLLDLYDKRQRNVCYLIKIQRGWGGSTTIKTPISAEFVKAIIDRMA